MTEERLIFKPKYDKIVELLLYLSHVRPNADHGQAVKFLYLADREHWNRHGRPITFDKYCAMFFGPVPSNAYDLLKKQDLPTMRKFGIKELPFEIEKLDVITYIRTPKRAVNHDLFSISDLKIFDEIISRYGTYTFDQLSKLTHDHFAWKKAWNQRGEKKKADMSYEDMMDESSDKSIYLSEIEAISNFMQ